MHSLVYVICIYIHPYAHASTKHQGFELSPAVLFFQHWPVPVAPTGRIWHGNKHGVTLKAGGHKKCNRVQQVMWVYVLPATAKAKS